MVRRPHHPPPPPPPTRPPLSTTLPPPSSSSPSSSSFVPSKETLAWLFSLPLPPGVSHQPQPRTPQDWALVEQYRLLCQSLAVLGDYERARRADGLEPVQWHHLCLDLAPPPPSFPPPVSDDAYSAEAREIAKLLPSLAAASAAAAGHAPSPRAAVLDTPVAPIGRDDDDDDAAAVAHLSESLAAFPSSSFTFSSSGSLADGSLSLDLSLPLDLDASTGPASLPSLMSAISELEHCVARLSLEANEARNLQKSLRSEMANRHARDRTTIAGSAPWAAAAHAAGDPGQANAVARGRAGAGRHGGPRSGAAGGQAPLSAKQHGKKPEKRPSYDEDDARLGGTTSRGDRSGERGASRALTAASADRQHSFESHCEDCGDETSTEDWLNFKDYEDEKPWVSTNGEGRFTENGDGGARESTSEHAGANGNEVGAGSMVAKASVGVRAGEVGGLGVKAWEDRELMKALESVSMLDKRADEYRERLRILKEQIHHHAALADALASSSSADSLEVRAGKSAKVKSGAGSARFGDVASDTGMKMVHLTRPKPR
ncbi:hypothetical protein JCM10212_003617 [Sporobolomyces blumeae]